MVQPQEVIQSFLNGWVYGLKKSVSAQEELAKQAEQFLSFQQSWVKQGMLQQQSLMSQWNAKWAERSDVNPNLNTWGIQGQEWFKKSWEEQEKAVDQSFSQAQTFLKQASEQQKKNNEQWLTIVEETGEKLKKWVQSSSPQI